jgi:hypothetical protein
MRLVFCSLVICCFAVGCDEPNTLTGSISQSHDLTFDDVSLRLFSEQGTYELKYTKALEGGGDDVVAKVVFDQPEGGVTADDELDLLALHGTIERITAADDPFPDGLDKANAVFSAGGNDDGEDSVGEFSSTFANGKTLNGTFSTPLEVVDF